MYHYYCTTNCIRISRKLHIKRKIFREPLNFPEKLGKVSIFKTSINRLSNPCMWRGMAYLKVNLIFQKYFWQFERRFNRIHSYCKPFLKDPLCNQKCFQNIFSKIMVQWASNFDKEPKKSLRNPACSYSKPCKMKTTCPTDRKLRLK